MTEEQFYDRDAKRFWDPFCALDGRDRVVLEILEGTGDQSVLEYGFGSGSLLLHLARKFRMAIGVEISQPVIDRFRDRVRKAEPGLLDNIRLIKTSGCEIGGVVTGSIDLIVAAAVLEHVFDPYAMLEELNRIARPVATLILTVPNYAYIKHRMHLFCGRLPKTGTEAEVEHWEECGWDGGHLHCFTRDSVSTLLESCGWSVDACRGRGDRFRWLDPLRRSFPALWSGELILRAHRSAQTGVSKAKVQRA